MFRVTQISSCCRLELYLEPTMQNMNFAVFQLLIGIHSNTFVIWNHCTELTLWTPKWSITLKNLQFLEPPLQAGLNKRYSRTSTSHRLVQLSLLVSVAIEIYMTLSRILWRFIHSCSPISMMANCWTTVKLQRTCGPNHDRIIVLLLQQYHVGGYSLKWLITLVLLVVLLQFRWYLPLTPIVTGSSILSSWSVGMDMGMSSTTPKLVPTHRHGVGRTSFLRPYDSPNCSVVTASLVSRSMLETLELRERVKEFSRLSAAASPNTRQRHEGAWQMMAREQRGNWMELIGVGWCNWFIRRAVQRTAAWRRRGNGAMRWWAVKGKEAHSKSLRGYRC